MKLIKTASGRKITMSRKEWEGIGKRAGWVKISQGSSDFEDPTREEMMDYLRLAYGAEEEWENEAEVAIYYFANHYHGGQWSNLYSALSTSPYSPGPFTTLESEGSMATDMYNDLVQKFAQ